MTGIFLINKRKIRFDLWPSATAVPLFSPSRPRCNSSSPPRKRVDLCVGSRRDQLVQSTRRQFVFVCVRTGRLMINWWRCEWKDCGRGRTTEKTGVSGYFIFVQFIHPSIFQTGVFLLFLKKKNSKKKPSMLADFVLTSWVWFKTRLWGRMGPSRLIPLLLLFQTVSLYSHSICESVFEVLFDSDCCS